VTKECHEHPTSQRIFLCEYCKCEICPECDYDHQCEEMMDFYKIHKVIRKVEE
jgi:hypothetical protein